MTEEIIIAAAYRMFEYEHTQLGWDVEWCKSNFNIYKDNYLKMAEIAFESLLENFGVEQ